MQTKIIYGSDAFIQEIEGVKSIGWDLTLPAIGDYYQARMHPVLEACRFNKVALREIFSVSSGRVGYQARLIAYPEGMESLAKGGEDAHAALFRVSQHMLSVDGVLSARGFDGDYRVISPSSEKPGSLSDDAPVRVNCGSLLQKVRAWSCHAEFVLGLQDPSPKGRGLPSFLKASR